MDKHNTPRHTHRSWSWTMRKKRNGIGAVAMGCSNKRYRMWMYTLSYVRTAQKIYLQYTYVQPFREKLVHARWVSYIFIYISPPFMLLNMQFLIEKAVCEFHDRHKKFYGQIAEICTKGIAHTTYIQFSAAKLARFVLPLSLIHNSNPFDWDRRSILYVFEFGWDFIILFHSLCTAVGLAKGAEFSSSLTVLPAIFISDTYAHVKLQRNIHARGQYRMALKLY